VPIAVGYGCPGRCNAAQEGFSQQVIRAAWFLKYGQQRSLGNVTWNVQQTNFPHSGNVWDNSDDPSYCRRDTPMTQGYRKQCSGDSLTYYDGYTSIDGSSIHLDTGGTAALYWYTPHKSGNSNFVNIFTNWFGSTLSNPIKAKVVDSHSSESGRTATVEYYLVQQPTDSVVIPVAVSDSSEATLNGVTSLTITAANWNKPENNKVIITGIDDPDADGDTAYTLVTGDPSSSDPAFDNLGSGDTPNARLYNDDNEPDVGLSGDWNGDGKDTVGVKRGSIYYLDNNNDGRADISFDYGKWADTPIVGDWTGDGKDTIGVKRDSNYYLNNGFDGRADSSVDYGR
jgi:hypothetical protein